MMNELEILHYQVKFSMPVLQFNWKPFQNPINLVSEVFNIDFGMTSKTMGK